MPSVPQRFAELRRLLCARPACCFAAAGTLQSARAEPLPDLVLSCCQGQLIQRKLQETLKKLFLGSQTVPVVALLPNHALALGLCFDTILFCRVFHLADLAHASWTTLHGKTPPGWQRESKGQFYGGDTSFLPKVTPLQVSPLSSFPTKEKYHVHDTEICIWPGCLQHCRDLGSQHRTITTERS